MNYHIIKTLKQTQKSSVYLASLEGIDTPVIIKILSRGNKNIYGILREHQNPHIPAVYDIETDESHESLTVAEEYVAGETLERYLEMNNPTPEERLKLFLQLCRALEFVHSFNPPIVHRDIKPSNIIIAPTGTLYIVDFDSSRIYDKAKDGSDTVLMGTQSYAAPEQFGFSQTDPRSDIYSLGVVLSELMGLSSDKSPSLGASFSDKAVRQIIGKCTAFDPAGRYPSVGHIIKDVEALLKNPGCQKKKKAVLLISAAAAVLVLAVCLCIILNKKPNIDTSAVWTNVANEKISFYSDLFEIYTGPIEAISEFSAEELAAFDEIIAGLDGESCYHYYPADPGLDFCYYSPFFDYEGYRFAGVQITNLQTGRIGLLNEDRYEYKDGIIYVKRDVMLEQSGKLLLIQSRFITDENEPMLCSIAVLIHDNDFVPVWQDVMFPNTPRFYPEKSVCTRWRIPYNTTVTIESITDENGLTIPSDFYEISESRRVVTFYPEMFTENVPGDIVVVRAHLSDGHEEIIRINIKALGEI